MNATALTGRVKSVGVFLHRGRRYRRTAIQVNSPTPACDRSQWRPFGRRSKTYPYLISYVLRRECLRPSLLARIHPLLWWALQVSGAVANKRIVFTLEKRQSSTHLSYIGPFFQIPIQRADLSQKPECNELQFPPPTHPEEAIDGGVGAHHASPMAITPGHLHLPSPPHIRS